MKPGSLRRAPAGTTPTERDGTRRMHTPDKETAMNRALRLLVESANRLCSPPHVVPPPTSPGC